MFRNIWTEPEYTCALCRATHVPSLNVCKLLSKSHQNLISFKRDFRFSQLCCWRFKSSEMWSCAVAWAVLQVPRDRNSFIFRSIMTVWHLKKAIQNFDKRGTTRPATTCQISGSGTFKKRSVFIPVSRTSWATLKFTFKSPASHVITLCTNINQSKRQFCYYKLRLNNQTEVRQILFSCVMHLSLNAFCFKQSMSFLTASNCVGWTLNPLLHPFCPRLIFLCTWNFAGTE